MTDEVTRPQLVLRAFGPDDEVALISWFATPAELRLFAGDSLRWPLDRRQLAFIRSDPSVTSWTAVAAEEREAPGGELTLGHIELTRLPERGWIPYNVSYEQQR